MSLRAGHDLPLHIQAFEEAQRKMLEPTIRIHRLTVAILCAIIAICYVGWIWSILK